MSKAKNIQLSDYSYHLAKERIAGYPVTPRDSSKLLLFKDDKISHQIFKDIHQHIDQHEFMLFNNTRVIQARLIFQKHSGALIEIFLLSPYLPDNYNEVFEVKNECVWKCMVGNKKKWKNEIIQNQYLKEIQAQWYDREKNLVQFTWEGNQTFAELIEMHGNIPIPPYLNRETEPADQEQYQTVYAQEKGSVAAPTAGLHFTPDVLDALKNNNIRIDYLTLHVGAGTFQPVQSENVLKHPMHTEMIAVNKNLIYSILKHANKTIAVGTTTVRTLESIYWLGVKILSGRFEQNSLLIGQWDYQHLPDHISLSESMHAILNQMQQNNLEVLWVPTQMMIIPGYDFKMVKAIVTNFHQPKSTLIMLIAAAVGDKWKDIYHYALQHDFRFLSYGDSSLLFLPK
jgi:S-adenosylmethionine:tRNA ribosyltransferase-isomerase